MDTSNIYIKSPIGNFYHGSDYKFDLTPPDGKPSDLHGIAATGTEGVLCMLSDCLGAERVVQAAKAISLPASREIIHVLPRQFIVDGESGVKDPVGMSGVRLEVDTHLVTTSTPKKVDVHK
jgi:hypothetical protein